MNKEGKAIMGITKTQAFFIMCCLYGTVAIPVDNQFQSLKNTDVFIKRVEKILQFQLLSESDVKLNTDAVQTSLSFIPSVPKIWESLSFDMKKELLFEIKTFIEASKSFAEGSVGNLVAMTEVKNAVLPQMYGVVDDLFGLIDKYGEMKATVVMTTMYITTQVLDNMKQWYKGEISGKRCAKNLIDSAAGLGGAFAGASIGIATGSFLGPWGTFVGGGIGSLAGSYSATKLSNWLTEWLFNLPKDVALAKAYEQLGVDRYTSNNDINRAYRAKAKKVHPDIPGGSHEEFLKLEISLAVIKVAREEL